MTRCCPWDSSPVGTHVPGCLHATLWFPPVQSNPGLPGFPQLLSSRGQCCTWPPAGPGHSFSSALPETWEDRYCSHVSCYCRGAHQQRGVVCEPQEAVRLNITPSSVWRGAVAPALCAHVCCALGSMAVGGWGREGWDHGQGKLCWTRVCAAVFSAGACHVCFPRVPPHSGHPAGCLHSQTPGIGVPTHLEKCNSHFMTDGAVREPAW